MSQNSNDANNIQNNHQEQNNTTQETDRTETDSTYILNSSTMYWGYEGFLDHIPRFLARHATTLYESCSDSETSDISYNSQSSYQEKENNDATNQNDSTQH